MALSTALPYSSYTLLRSKHRNSNRFATAEQGIICLGSKEDSVPIRPGLLQPNSV